MAKLSDRDLLIKFQRDCMTSLFENQPEYESRVVMFDEILKRMGKVDVHGLARELADEDVTGIHFLTKVVKYETILRSHMEGKSE